MKKSVEFTFHVSFFIYLAFMILLLPLPWLLGALFAAAVHECAHLSVIRIMGIKIYSITISSGGAKIQTGAMSPVQEFISAAAGPVGGLILLLGFKLFPQAAVCAFVQSLFNLLPLLPFDGGRILRSLSQIMFGKSISHKICKFSQWFMYILLVLVCFYLLKFGFFRPLIIIVLLMRSTKMHCIEY